MVVIAGLYGFTVPPPESEVRARAAVSKVAPWRPTPCSCDDIYTGIAANYGEWTRRPGGPVLVGDAVVPAAAASDWPARPPCRRAW